MILFLKRILMEGEAGNGGAPAGGAQAAAPAAAAQAPAAPAVATPAQPATPATPAAPAASAQAEPLIGGKTEAINFQKTGNTSLDIALEFIGKHGFDENHPAMQEAGRNNFGPLRAIFAQLGDKAPPGWSQMIDIGEAAFKDFAAAQQAKKAAEAEVHAQIASDLGVDIPGMVEWANANADPDEKEAFNKMMDAGGLQAQAAMFFMASQYANSLGGQGRSAVVNPAVSQPTGQGTISRAELAQEGKKLYDKYGDRYNQTPEYQALLRRVAR